MSKVSHETTSIEGKMDKEELAAIYRKSISICKKKFHFSNEDSEEIAQSVVLKYLEYLHENKKRSKSLVVQAVIDQVRIKFGRVSKGKQRTFQSSLRQNEKMLYKEYNETTQTGRYDFSIDEVVDIKRKMESIKGNDRVAVSIYNFVEGCELSDLAHALEVSGPRVNQIIKKVKNKLESE